MASWGEPTVISCSWASNSPRIQEHKNRPRIRAYSHTKVELADSVQELLGRVLGHAAAGYSPGLTHWTVFLTWRLPELGILQGQLPSHYGSTYTVGQDNRC